MEEIFKPFKEENVQKALPGLRHSVYSTEFTDSDGWVIRDTAVTSWQLGLISATTDLLK